jgi:hypothetical protein
VIAEDYMEATDPAPMNPNHDPQVREEALKILYRLRAELYEREDRPATTLKAIERLIEDYERFPAIVNEGSLSESARARRALRNPSPDLRPSPVCQNNRRASPRVRRRLAPLSGLELSDRLPIPPCDRLPDQEENDGADDRSDPRAPVEELVDRVTESNRLRDEAGDQSSCYADEGCHDEPAGLLSGQDRLGDQASKQTQDDPTDDSHRNLLVIPVGE